MDRDIATLLEGFPIVTRIVIHWGEMDAYQHVNNANYFRWYETARIAYTTRIGLPELMKERKIGPILANASCDFKRPVVFPDRVHVGSRVVRIGRASVQMEQRIVSESYRSIVAEGGSTLVVYDYAANAPHPVPTSIRQAIEALEGRSF